MSDDFSGLGYRLILYVGLGGVLLVVLKAAATGLELVPMSRARKETLRRVMPVAGAVLLVGYCLFVVRTLFRNQPAILPLALALVLSAFVAAAWAPLRDVVTGVFLKAGRVCVPGDTVHVGEVRGRVIAMSHRTLSVETERGEQVVIPYGLVAKGTISKVPVLAGTQAHVFELTLPAQKPVAESLRRVQLRAMRHHWSSFVRAPEVKLLAERVCRVTVFPLTQARASEIEECVRRELAD